MTRLVVDASVAIKWVLPEEHDAAARALLDGGHELLAPDLIHSEVGNVLWKRVGRGELTPDEAAAALAALLAAPLQIAASHGFVSMALDVALQTGRTVYDALYIALALTDGCRMVTADQRLFNAIAAGPFAPRLAWIGDPL